MNIKQLNSLKSVIFIGIAIFLAFNFDNSLSNLVTKSDISWVIGSIVLRLIITLSFARGFQLGLKVLKPNLKFILTFLVGTLLGFTISFVLRPIYDIDYGHFDESNKALDIQQFKLVSHSSLDLNNKPAIIAFFHTDCNGCKEMSNDLGKYQALGHIPQVFACFAGTEEDAQTFMDQHNGQNYQPIMIDNDDYFLETADYAFPAVFFINGKGETVTLWHSSGLSYYALDIIKSNY